MKNQEMSFICEQCGERVKPVRIRGEFFHLRRLESRSQRKYGKTLCFRCWMMNERKQMEETTAELCRGCTWNYYDVVEGKCPARQEAEAAGLREKNIVHCTDYVPLERK